MTKKFEIDRFTQFSFNISEISKYWHKLAADELRKYGLKGPHATYLTTMYRFPDGITVPQLCELCGKDKSDASRMIAILEQNSLVKKQSVDGSLYRGLLILTDEGRLVAEKVLEKASRAVEIAGRELTEETRDIFYKSLDSISSNLRELSKEGIPE